MNILSYVVIHICEQIKENPVNNKSLTILICIFLNLIIYAVCRCRCSTLRSRNLFQRCCCRVHPNLRTFSGGVLDTLVLAGVLYSIVVCIQVEENRSWTRTSGRQVDSRGSGGAGIVGHLDDWVVFLFVVGGFWLVVTWIID